MNKKGFTTVELLVSLSLTAVIVLFLFQIIFVLKDLYVSNGIKIKLLTKQSTLNSMIYDDFISKKITLATKCGDNCIDFYFDGSPYKRLSYNKASKTITYGSFATKLIEGSKFGNINIKTEVLTTSYNINQLNGILTISIPIYHDLIPKEDFGINVIYLYNSNKTSLAGLNITDIVDAERQIYLVNENDIAFEGLPYKDPGYYVLNSLTSEVVHNDTSVEVTGEVNTNKIGNYYKSYTLYDMNGNIMDHKVRTINVIKSENTFDFTGEVQTFNVPVSGIYKIELWGASGGGTINMSGKGGYTTSQYRLKTEDKLYLYVGGKGTMSETNSAAVGGFNGGGNSGISTNNFAGSGGGASDIRLNNDSLAARILVAGGGGGGGSRNDSTISCNGGFGGGETAGYGVCTSDSYLGYGGTQTAGGAKATYNNSSIISSPTNGALGIGGTGASYSSDPLTYAAGGGGGGFYGGGGGARYGGGGGGSSLCGGIICTAYKGTETFYTTDGKSYEMGHNGNGYIKITLLSIG